MKKKQCSFCGNTHLSQKDVRYIYQHQDSIMVVDDVPCLECDYCSEQYFNASVLKKIEQDFVAVSEQQKVPARSMQVAIETFSAL